MKRMHLALTAAMLAACSVTAFAEQSAAEARQERMDQAYEDSRNPNPGPAARAERSMKRGAAKNR